MKTEIKFASCALIIAPTRMFTGDSQHQGGRGIPLQGRPSVQKSAHSATGYSETENFYSRTNQTTRILWSLFAEECGVALWRLLISLYCNGQLINGAIGNLGYDRDMPYILEHLTSLRQEITDLRNMNAKSAARSADSQIDQSAVEMRANRLAEIKKELSQMLNRPEDPRVWWEKGGRRNRVA